MPTYTYKCDNCGVQFEQFQKFSDKPLKRCPECSQSTLRRVIGASAIVFKGSGWYATDNRSPSGQSAAKKYEAEADKANKPEKADAKAEAKAEAKPDKPEKKKDAKPHKHDHD
jgi:putative FmdB family regulatory protein